jgi:hypothetical protein
MRSRLRGYGLVLCVVLGSVVVTAQTARKPVGQVPTPASILGFEPGTDRRMADTAQIEKYFRTLAAAVPERMQIREIGKSWEGRPLLLAIITSEANMQRLDRFREISHRLALAKDLTDEEASKLAREGRSVILVNHGKDGNEPATGEAAMLLAHHLLSSENAEARMIRDTTIVLIAPAINPDGREYMLKWYRKILGTPFEMTAREPWYDHPMFGHEGNRDLVNLQTPEMAALAKVLWHEWNPQIVVDQHQGVPYPARIFVPPYADPYNPSIAPLVQRGINTIGQAMAMRLEREGKTGVISNAMYTSWANGGVSDSVNFHNQIGILVETQQRPARWASPGFLPPEQLPKSFNIPSAGPGMVPDAPSVFYPNPWRGGWWKYRDQVDYMVTASMGSIAIAAQLREDWLRNTFQLGKENIEKGRRGDPFAWIIPPDQWDRGEAIELVNTLQREAVEVHKATAPFTAGGQSYPAGSYIAYAAQAFRNEMLDVLDPHRHPNLRQYPGGPPIPPYDQATWNLPFGLGVRVDRIKEPFEAASSLLTAPEAVTGAVTGSGPVYVLSTKENASFKALNALWSASVSVSRASAPFEAAGREWQAGTFIVRGDPAKLVAVAQSAGVDFVGAGQLAVNGAAITRPKIGVYQSWVVVDHNPDEGWMRWMLEQYGYEYKTLHDADVRAENLSAFTAIVIPDQPALDILRGHERGTMPEEYVGGVGAEGAANLKRFVEKGGTLLVLNTATTFGIEQFGLPVRNEVENVPSTELHVPGSYLRATVNTGHPLGYGMPPHAAFLYFRRRAPQQMAFSLVNPAGRPPGQLNDGVSVAASFDERDLLLSGWEVGADRYLAGTPAVVQLSLGAGSVVLENFRPHWRGEAHGTYKFVLNALLLSSTAKPTGQQTTQRR